MVNEYEGVRYCPRWYTGCPQHSNSTSKHDLSSTEDNGCSVRGDTDALSSPTMNQSATNEDLLECADDIDSGSNNKAPSPEAINIDPGGAIKDGTRTDMSAKDSQNIVSKSEHTVQMKSEPELENIFEFGTENKLLPIAPAPQAPVLEPTRVHLGR